MFAVSKCNSCGLFVRLVLFTELGDENFSSKWSASVATILTISFIVAILVIPAQVFRSVVVGAEFIASATSSTTESQLLELSPDPNS